MLCADLALFDEVCNIGARWAGCRSAFLGRAQAPVSSVQLCLAISFGLEPDGLLAPQMWVWAQGPVSDPRPV